MGTYHTFFVADEDELDRLFPGWKPVAPEKVPREIHNPFTKEKMVVPLWVGVEPPTPLGKPSLYDDVWGPAVAPIIPVENDYMGGIERAGAPGLRALPHFRAKNCEPFQSLMPLAAALLDESVPVPPARIGCAGDDDIAQVEALPAAALERLVALDDSELPAIVDKVLASTGTTGEGDEAQTYYVARVLRPLKSLALAALGRGGRLCHYWAMHY